MRPTRTIPAQPKPSLHQIEKMLVTVDDDRARLLGGAELDDLALEGLRHLLVGSVVFSRLLLVVVDPFVRLRVEDLRLRGKCNRRANHCHGEHGAKRDASAAGGRTAIVACWRNG